MEKITVMCVLWRNDKGNNLYTVEWVRRLANMVKKNLQIPYKFICLTNKNFEIKGIECIPLEHNWPGWWSKIELFRPDLPNTRTLYLDLDLVVIKDLLPFIEYPGELITCSAFGNPQNHKGKRVHGVRRGYNSSVMVFDRGEFTEKIYKLFNRAPKRWMKIFRGHQDFLKHFFPMIAKFPEYWIKKLIQCVKDDKCKIPEDLKIMLCMPEKNVIAVKKYKEIAQLWL
jgi:hypothetical protein